MAAFDADSTVPPQVFEGSESVSIIVLGGEIAQVENTNTSKPRTIVSNAKVIRK